MAVTYSAYLVLDEELNCTGNTLNISTTAVLQALWTLGACELRWTLWTLRARELRWTLRTLGARELRWTLWTLRAHKLRWTVNFQSTWVEMNSVNPWSTRVEMNSVNSQSTQVEMNVTCAIAVAFSLLWCLHCQPSFSSLCWLWELTLCRSGTLMEICFNNSPTGCVFQAIPGSRFWSLTVCKNREEEI